MKRLVGVVVRVVQEYLADDCPMRSASIAYFALASLFPGLLLMLTMLGHFVSDAQAQERVAEMVTYYLPVPTLKSFVRDNLHAVTEWRGWMGIVGVVVLLWSCKGTFLAAERGINVIWSLKRRRHTVRAYLLAIMSTVLLGTLLFLQFTVIALLRTAVTAQIPIVGYSPEWLGHLWSVLSLIISPLTLFLVFLLLYTLLPSERLPLHVVWIGAAFSAVSYRVLESGFIYYITYVARLTLLYGAASGLLVLMLWLYLSSNIFFIGAELIKVNAWDQGLLTKPDGSAGAASGAVSGRIEAEAR